MLVLVLSVRAKNDSGGPHGEDSRDRLAQKPNGAGTSDQTTTADQESAADQSNQRTTPKGATEDSGQNGGRSDNKGNGKPSRFDRQLKWTDFFIALFGGLSFAAAAISAGVAIWTAGELREASNQTDNAIGRIAEVANATEDEANSVGNEVGQMTTQTGLISNQAGAAVSQAKTAREQFEVLKAAQRAFIYPTLEDLRFSWNNTLQEWAIAPHWENTGATQALDLHVQTHCITAFSPSMILKRAW